MSPASPGRSDLPSRSQPVRFFRHRLSGHSHRVELMLNLLALPYESIDVDLRSGEHRRPPFLALNPFGKVPVIDDGEHVIADSTAILVYLVRRHVPDSHWLPDEPAAAAEIQRWFSIAAGPLVTGPAEARLARLRGRDPQPQSLQIAQELFATLDRHLHGRPFLVGDTATLADVAMYSYVALAPEGGITLEDWPAIVRWLARLESHDRFLAIRRPAHADGLTRTPVKPATSSAQATSSASSQTGASS